MKKNLERETYYFIQTINRATKSNMPEFCGCLYTFEEAKELVSKAENGRFKMRSSIYKVELNTRRVLAYAGYNLDDLAEETDILKLFHTATSGDFASFYASYPYREDISIIEGKHHIF
jgi:citrate synthase